ncbi:MAG: sugar phosphate nucleotidyltransferase [Sphingobacteriales bacterium]|nr:sugar phosphate nucleotidyltransferase [Sphingobacteriales bacterium]
MKPTLVILAAGMASRYGSMKQIDGFGPNGETIIDYSIYDAIQAGFGKVVFIIREEFADNFKAIFEPKLAGKIATDYVYQSYDLKPFGMSEEIERAKPWGTAHAVLAAKDAVKEPFCVINADDFYSRDSYEQMAKFLTSEVTDERYSLMGFQINKTLSDYGSVSRGVCQVNDAGLLSDIHERTQVYFKGSDVVYEENGIEFPLASNTPVSMNFWGFTPKVFEDSVAMFVAFALANKDNPKAEFFIPLVAEKLIKEGKASFKVLPTDSKWFGVTYKEDKPIVQASIDALVSAGVYPSNLWK